MRHRLRATEHVRHAEVDDVESVAEQRDVGSRFVTEELAVPDPRITWRGLLGHDDARRVAGDKKLVAVEAVPVGLLAGERFRVWYQLECELRRLDEIHDLNVEPFGLIGCFSDGQSLGHPWAKMANLIQPGIGQHTLSTLNEFQQFTGSLIDGKPVEISQVGTQRIRCLQFVSGQCADNLAAFRHVEARRRRRRRMDPIAVEQVVRPL